MLLYKTAPGIDEIQHRVSGDKNFAQLAHSFDHESLYSIIENLNKSAKDMKWASHPRIVLEMGLIRLVEANRSAQGESHQTVTDPSLDELNKRITQLEAKLEQRIQSIPTGATNPITEQRRTGSTKKEYNASHC